MTHVSPSQVETFLSCPRKWAFDKIAGLRPPDTRSTNLGSEIHGHLERWIKDGTPPDVSLPSGEIALRAIGADPSVIPPRHEIGLVAEEAVDDLVLRRPDGSWSAAWTYRKDLVLRPEISGRVWVADYKSCRTLAWVKSPDYLSERDAQGIVYSATEYLGVRPSGAVGPKPEQVFGTWIYLTTARPYRVHPVNFRPEARSSVERFWELDDCGRFMTHLRTVAPDPNDLLAETRTCGAYGGCAYRGVCSARPDPFAAFGRKKGNEMTESLTAASILARAKAASVKVGQAPEQVPAAPVPAAPVPAEQVPDAPAEPEPPPWLRAAQVPAAQVPAAQVPAAQVPAAQVPAAQVPAAPVPAAPVPAAQVPKRGRPPKTTSTDPEVEILSAPPPVCLEVRTRLACALLSGPGATLPTMTQVEILASLSGWVGT